MYTNGADFADMFKFARTHRAALNAERVRNGFRLAGFAVHSPIAARNIELGYRVSRFIERGGN